MTLDERIIEAQRRISAGLAPMRIPADQCDPDIVLSACQATIAELVAALTGLERRFLDPKTGDPGGSCWCDPYRYLELQGHEDECEVARAALAKAKGANHE